MLILIAAALSDPDIGPDFEAAQQQVIACTGAEVRAHFKDDMLPPAIAEAALQACQQSWDKFLFEYRKTLNNIVGSSKIGKHADMSGREQRAALISGLTGAVTTLRQREQPNSSPIQ